MAEIILKEAGKPVTRLVLDAAGLTVGSHPKNELVLEGDLIQPVHVRIHAPDGDAFVLEALSPNAHLLLNGKPVSRLAELKTGDEITLGPHRMTVDLHARRKPRRASPPLRAEPTMLFSEGGAPPGEPGKLVWFAGDSVKEEFSLSDKTMVVGRADDCDICIDNETVSKRHAEVKLEGKECLIRDLDSLNGTLVNGKAVAEARVRGGERIRVGKVDLQFVPSGKTPRLERKGKGLPGWIGWVLAGMGLVLSLVSAPGLVHRLRGNLRAELPAMAFNVVEKQQILLDTPPRSISMGHLSDPQTVEVVLAFEDRLEAWKRTGESPTRSWSANLRLHQACSPLLLDVDEDGTHEVLAVTVDPKIVCLEGATGVLTPWGAALPEYPDTDPVICHADDDQVPDVAVGTRDGRVRFLSGRRYLEEVRPPAYVQDPVAALCSFEFPELGSVVVAAAKRRVYALDARKGNLVWTGEAEGELMDLAAFVGESAVWVACMTTNSVHLFEGRSGTLQASVPLPGFSPWPPVSSQCEDRPGFYIGLLGGALYFLSKDGVMSQVPEVEGTALVPLRASLTKGGCQEMIIPRAEDLLILSQPGWRVLGSLPLLETLRACPVVGDWTGSGELSIVGLDGEGMQVLDAPVPVRRGHVAWLGESEWRSAVSSRSEKTGGAPILLLAAGVGLGLLMAVGGSAYGLQSLRRD